MRTITPLRYPGGKTSIADIIADKICRSGLSKYAEPFAGGAGAGLYLLASNVISHLYLNDNDPAVYSIWNAILYKTDDFIHFVKTVPVDINEYRRQKTIYERHNNALSFKLGCAAFFLNRTNMSGIITGGPIGGYDQTGKYKIDCRFGRKNLIGKIQTIAKLGDKISIYNLDAANFIRNHITPDTYIYLDPPYVEKAKRLYKNSFTTSDHRLLRDTLLQIDNPWLLSYDNHSNIRGLYDNCGISTIQLSYSIAHSGRRQELLIEKQ